MTRLVGTFCEDCKFFNPKQVGELGTCQRHAPHGPVVITPDSNINFFPMVPPTSWCGEFEKKIILN